ncbi:MAG: hypothetical protein JWN32_1941 [Solirubrobacterales bacterium]|nr:hypothetical protein [Solirubrobacterales bacterium]
MTPAGAGTTLLTTLAVMIAAGAGLGSLVHQPIAGGLIGLFVGAVTGFVVVYKLYRDL